jgi:hypothetical protein
MRVPGFRLRHLAFHGPSREPAVVSFGPGLNVVYGASDTGKSFIVEALDFMLGGKVALRDMPERVGYDRVFLGIQTIPGDEFTLSRSADGGRFRLFPGLHVQPPPEDASARDLAEQHNERSSDNLSMFLLELCDLNGKRVRKNKAGDTVSLSFRNLARLMIVTETEIMSQRSPLSDGNPVVDTPNFATFKLLLTGVDDSALVPRKPATPEDQSREAQVELLDQLIDDYHKRVKELARDPEELEGQMVRLEATLSQHAEQLTTTEAEYRQIVNRRREVRERLESGRDRRSEIAGLLERFELLDRHYDSDLARLHGIEEAGTLFGILGQSVCPLCGSAPEHHRRGLECDGDVDAVVAAAGSEIAKIELLRRELAETQETLRREGRSFDRRLPKVETELQEISERVDRLISPRLTRLRANYGDVADKRGEVREALSIYRTFLDMQRRREALENGADERRGSSVSDGDLPLAVAEAFALKVEAVLKEWHFPDAERVFFDAKARDMVIAGKLRTARGKGLRAITHAAFTVSLLEYCREQRTPHPGFVCFDSPLLAYRAPEGKEDDLSGTDLNERFYDHLTKLPDDQQVIVVENRDPPQAIIDRPQTEMFSGTATVGRFGFFPLADGVPADSNGSVAPDRPPAD